jgi:hypothetical protein
VLLLWQRLENICGGDLEIPILRCVFELSENQVSLGVLLIETA